MKGRKKSDNRNCYSVSLSLFSIYLKAIFQFVPWRRKNRPQNLSCSSEGRGKPASKPRSVAKSQVERASVESLDGVSECLVCFSCCCVDAVGFGGFSDKEMRKPVSTFQRMNLGIELDGHLN